MTPEVGKWYWVKWGVLDAKCAECLASGNNEWVGRTSSGHTYRHSVESIIAAKSEDEQQPTPPRWWQRLKFWR